MSLTPTSCLCHSSVIDLVMLNSSLNSSYLSQQPFLLLQPSSLTNFSNRPWYYVSLHCFSHYTSLFISVSVVPILRPPFSILPLSSPRSFPMFCTIFFILSHKFLYVDKITPCPAFESSMFPKALILFLNSMFYLYLISSLCSLLRSNLSLTFFLPSGLANCRLILVLTR